MNWNDLKSGYLVRVFVKTGPSFQFVNHFGTRSLAETCFRECRRLLGTHINRVELWDLEHKITIREADYESERDSH